MYIHAYQSYLWNRMVSERLERYDQFNAVEGDLVLPNRDSWDTGDKVDIDPDPDPNPNPNCQVLDIDPDPNPNPNWQVLDIDPEAEVEPEREAITHRRSQGKPKIVTAEEASAGTYSLDDVVLPLPGMEVLYPTHAIGSLYKATLEEDKVDKVIAEGHATREYSLTGAYRYMIARPHDLEWSILRYKDKDEDLSYNDLDALNGIPRKSHTEGDLKALQMAFTLPSSTYATMLLREVMKTSTSASFHRNKELTQETSVKPEDTAAAAPADELPPPAN